jgi:hypothetical protein
LARSGEPTETEYVDGSKREFGKGSHLPRQPLQHQADHGHLDEPLARLHLPLVVLAQTAVPHQPGERALHDSPVGQDGETFGIRAPTTPLDDLQFPLVLLIAPPSQLLSRVGSICPDPLQTRYKLP